MAEKAAMTSLVLSLLDPLELQLCAGCGVVGTNFTYVD
jgi:hypothetical protein